MKKLICALVLLAMLVPVAAMAEELFSSKIDFSVSLPEGYSLSYLIDGDSGALNGSRYQINYNNGGVEYTAWYYPSGVLEQMMVSYNGPGLCGCGIMYGADGTMQEGPTHVKPGCSHTPPFPVHTIKDDSPEENVMDVIPDYNGDYDDFIAKLTEKLNNTNVSSSAGVSKIIPAGDDFYVSAVNGNALYVHYGPVVYNGKLLRVYGDSKKYLFAWAQYNTEDGSLNHYGIFSADGSIETVYDAKNRLMSTELWTPDDAYWRFEGDGWVYSASGNPKEAKPETPTKEVLNKITLSPRAAKFPVSFANSVANVRKEDIGTPIVIGGVEAETEATMKDHYTSVYQMKTVGDSGFKQPIDFLVPYGAGQDRATAEQFTYTVEHEYAPGKLIKYSTDPTDDTYIKATFTDKGILLPDVSSFSPFAVTWGDKQASTVGVDSLPSTGDNSNLMLFAGLLAMSAAALLVISKRRAHQ